MKTLQMLLGCSERRTAAVIEATVLDVCYNRAAVKTAKVPRLGEFTRSAVCGSVELMVLVPHLLLAEPRLGEPTTEMVVQAVWLAKNRCPAPLVLLSSSAQDEYRFLEAGADAVLSGTLKPEDLHAQLARLISLPEPEEPLAQPKWSFASIFSRKVKTETETF